uniref:Phosphotransferase n=1 Tax=Panagrolaimus sp. PS1159 TaxID=55785 RepID=A0AC35FT82_9BILA
MSLPEAVVNTLKSFELSRERLAKISEDIQKEFVEGLKYGADKSSIAMLPSYVPALPDGNEIGKYVAIDLSGKNLRILLLDLKGKGQDPSITTSNFIVSNTIMKGTGEQLFAFIVNCLQKFLKEFELEDANLPIGFVFSYPCELLSIRSARLLWWTKGFDIEDCLHKDVVELLQEALELNMSTNAKIKAVMNDTVGQLAAAAYKYGPECTVGVVIGYGCNSSYLEETKNIEKFNPKTGNYPHEKMIVVTEWEEFGSKNELDDILTQFDKEIDEASVHKGKQIIDKLTEEGGSKITRRICDELDVVNHGSNDYAIIRAVCQAISQRSASIVAAAICALLRHINHQKVKIGVGGALIQFHPTYHKMLEAQMNMQAPLNVEWELVHADEGSAKGAALIAAVAEKMRL